MTEAIVKNAIDASVVGVTRHVMATRNLPDYEAYRSVSESKTYALLSDPRTRLYLLMNAELSHIYDCKQDGQLELALKTV